MKCLTIVFQSSYALLTLCLGAAGYIYVVHGLGGDTVMGTLVLGITGIFAAMLYRLGGWFVQEALPQLKRIDARRREVCADAKTAKANVPVPVEDLAWAEIAAYTRNIFKEYLPGVEIERLLVLLENLRRDNYLLVGSGQRIDRNRPVPLRLERMDADAFLFPPADVQFSAAGIPKYARPYLRRYHLLEDDKRLRAVLYTAGGGRRETLLTQNFRIK